MMMSIAPTFVANLVISDPQKRVLNANIAVDSWIRLIAVGIIVTIALSASFRCMSMTGNQETG